MAQIIEMTQLPERVAKLESAFDGFKEKMSEQIADFKRGMSEQIAELKKIMAWGLSIGLAGIIGVWGGIAFVYFQISDLKTNVAVAEVKLNGIDERVRDIFQIVRPFQQSLIQLQMDVTAIRTQPKSGPGGTDTKNLLNVPLLSDSERILIMKSIPSEIAKMIPNADQLKIGDVIPDRSALNPIPDAIAQKVPQLQGTQYTLGKASILIAAPPEYRVVAVVSRQ